MKRASQTATSLLKPLSARAARPQPVNSLGGFGSPRILGVYQCPGCTCAHHGISEADAIKVVASTNAYLSTLDAEEIKEWYGGSVISIEPFTKCFFCGTSSRDFMHVAAGERGRSVSHQTVIVEDPTDVAPGNTSA